MRNPIFKAIKPNYRSNVFEIQLKEGSKIKAYQLPFFVFTGKRIGVQNKVSSIAIDRELGDQSVSMELENGTRFDFPSDFVLYYCDPSYNWSPLNQLKKSLKDKLSASKLSVRVLADALNTSPSQVVRLLEENKGSRQFLQLFQLAEMAGYQIEFHLKKKAA